MTSYDVLALDAMGVLYQVADDVAELLVPFVRDHGGIKDSQMIEAAYIDASLGRISNINFWNTVSVSTDLEDEYLFQHQLVSDAGVSLKTASTMFSSICCISNDVAEWSLKLRRRFGLEPTISSWFISGDIGYRKPDQEIYQAAVRRLGVAANRILFVDDRLSNLDTAAGLGMGTVWLSSEEKPVATHRRFASLSSLVCTGRKNYSSPH